MYFYSSIKIGRFTDKIVAWFNWMTWLHFIKTKKLYQETVFRLLHQFLSWNKEYCHFWILHKLGCWKMYKNTFFAILEAEKSQKPKCSSKIMNSMSACMDFMFFMSTSVFAISKLLRCLEKRFYTFSNSPAYAEFKNSDIFMQG